MNVIIPNIHILIKNRRFRTKLNFINNKQLVQKDHMEMLNNQNY